MRPHGFGGFASLLSLSLCFSQVVTQELPPAIVVRYGNTAPGVAVKTGTKLRILPVGDSITVGWLGDDHNGYRKQLRDNLSEDEVVYAGTEQYGPMDDPYFAAWTGKTIKYMHDHIDESLAQRPNIILLHAGTNDMNPDPNVSTEADGAPDPAAAAERLGNLIDKMFTKCPDATILVAMILPTTRSAQRPQTVQYQALIPGVVQTRFAAGKHIMAVDFSAFDTALLRDGVHPTDAGYRKMGDWWYDFMTQIPKSWISAPVGDDPVRDVGRNGGPDENIPPLDPGTSPIEKTSPAHIVTAAKNALGDKVKFCRGNPQWYSTGRLASGRGVNGDWKFTSKWLSEGEVMPATNLDPQYVRFHDMDGDGKADYVWIHPDTGAVHCWLNKYPNSWVKAGINGKLTNGRGRSKSIFLADMNGDGKDDYLVVNPDDGSADIYWNHGPDAGWAHGWKFVEGGQVASGVPHANWDTLRLADMNGDGRADYMTVGVRGSLALWLNRGSLGTDVKWLGQGGITAGGSVTDFDQLVFADIDGDGRADYLIVDDEAGISGFLNIMTQRSGLPGFAEQEGAKSIATGIPNTKNYKDIRLADIDGDGKADYLYVASDGSVHLWLNRGSADTSRASDSVVFADIDGDGVDDYVIMGHDTGSVTVYLNKGADSGVGWGFEPVNGGNHVASGRAPASQVVWGDINGDGKDDYLVLHPETGALSVWINEGSGGGTGWRFKEIGQIASGLGPGARVRIADIDGDGYDDYIFLKPNGGTTIYRNNWKDGGPGNYFNPLPDQDASGINENPDEIQFVDINGDGRADYVWTRSIDGVAQVWFNQYSQASDRRGWREGGVFASGVGANGDNVRYAIMDKTNRASYIVLDPATGALGAWLNGCDNGCIDRFKPCCPDPFSPCEYLSEDGCEFGYSACLQKMGCSNKPGEADCIGVGIGCAHCRDHKPPSSRRRRSEPRGAMVLKI